jgi:hypothetical protein
MSVYLASADYNIASPSGDDLFGNMMVGGDGNGSGCAETTVGDDQGGEYYGYYTWCESEGDGFNSGGVPVSFVADSDGYESLEVSTNDPVTYNGDSIGPIGSVVFQAAVTEQGSAEWSDISVDFYSGSTLVETDSAMQGPEANTTDTPSTPQKEQLMTVTPSASDITSVKIAGEIQLTAPAGSTPGPTGMFCNVFIFGQSGHMEGT